MKRYLFGIKYPKFLLLLLTFIFAYLIFAGRNSLLFYDSIASLGYIGTFITGIFFAYGFTSAPASAILMILAREQNFVLSGFIAGAGSLVGDLMILKFIRYSFKDEIRKLSKENIISDFNRKIPKSFRKYFIAVFAGFLIASPLPDEVGVPLLVSTTKISMKLFSLLSYALHTAGIFAILSIGIFIR